MNQEPNPDYISSFSQVEYTLEQQVAFEIFSRQVDRMSLPQAQHFLREYFLFIQQKDSVFKQLLKNGFRPPSKEKAQDSISCSEQAVIDELTNKPIGW